MARRRPQWGCRLAGRGFMRRTGGSRDGEVGGSREIRWILFRCRQVAKIKRAASLSINTEETASLQLVSAGLGKRKRLLQKSPRGCCTGHLSLQEKSASKRGPMCEGVEISFFTGLWLFLALNRSHCGQNRWPESKKLISFDHI